MEDEKKPEDGKLPEDESKEEMAKMQLCADEVSKVLEKHGCRLHIANDLKIVRNAEPAG